MSREVAALTFRMLPDQFVKKCYAATRMFLMAPSIKTPDGVRLTWEEIKGAGTRRQGRTPCCCWR